jgi:hypothetical protein
MDCLKQGLRALTAFILMLFTGMALAAPIDFFHVEDIAYDESVPAPEDHFGYEIGELPVRFADMTQYLAHIAESSDRIDMEIIGYSHERRPIITYTVSSPENLANLETIKDNHHARLRGESAPDSAPMVLWINYGVHGAETSSMDAAIPLLYHFASAQGDAVETMLNDAVMIFTVVFNPDGHARRIDHVSRFWSYADNTDINDEAHNHWTEARTNHYWFDLNRQWLLLTQPEPQAWIKKWHEWKPMVSADYHEMGSSSPYHFHPGEPLRRNALIPARARELAFEIGRRHAEFFDGETRLYSTQQVFDNFYVGKGSTYPQVNGAIGILFEAGAARGGAVMTERGLVETADNVRSQFRTALTTLQGSLDLRDEITAYQRDFFAQSTRSAVSTSQRAWVFKADGDPERANRFVRLLRMHDIEVFLTDRDIRAGEQLFEAGTAYVVPLNQLQYTMITSIFERRTEFPENIFYDVSGWTLPLAYDLEYAAVSGGGFNAQNAGTLVDGAMTPAATPDVAPYAYIFDWSNTYAPRAVHRLQAEGVRVRTSREPFNVETTQGIATFGRGSIVVALARQDVSNQDIHTIIEQIAAEDGIPVSAAISGLTPVDGRDLGAWNIFEVLPEPKVVLAFEDGLSYYDSGEIWWTLDHQHRMPVTIVRKDNLTRLDWPDYTHLILVGGNGRLEDSLTEELQGWVRDGGTIIATRQSARWVQNEFLSDEEDDGSSESASDDGEILRHDVETMRRRDAEHIIGGAIFEADLDVSHPLGFGYADRTLPVHRNTTIILDRPDDPFAVPVEYVDEPLLTGYASDIRVDQIAGTPSVVTSKMGRGQIILMADNPVFRGTYPGTEKLLMNSIFFSSLIQRSRGTYEDD